MADSAVVVTAGTGTNIDTRTEATNGHHRQVVVLGDPATNAGVAPVDATAGLKVDLGADNDVTVTSGTITAVTAITNALPAGTNAIGKLSANSGVDIGDVDVTSSALPTGASTLAEQQTQTTALQLIDDVVATDDTTTHTPASTKGVTMMAAATPTDTSVNANDIGAVAMTNDRKLHVSVQDSLPAGTALMGKVSIDQVTANANEVVTKTGSVTAATLSAETTKVIGTVNQGTSPWVVTGGGGGTEYVTNAVVPADPTGTTVVSERDDQLSTLTEVEGDWTNTRATSKGALWVAIPDSNGDPITSFGGGTQYTEGDTDATITGTASMVEGAANALAVMTQPLTDTQIRATALPVSLTSTTVTGTVAVTQSGTWDEVGINDSGNSITVDNAQLSVVGTGTEATAMRVTIASDSTGVLSVDDNGGALTVDGTVTANLAAGTNNIGDVDVLTLPTTPSGTNYIGKVRLTDGTTDTDIRDLANSNALNVSIVDGSGDQITSFGGGTQYTEDAAAAANPTGTAPILVRTDTPATQVTTDGDNVAQRGTNYGAAYVQLVTSAGAYIDSVGGGTQYAVDAALGATPTGTLGVAIRDDALSALTPVEGDAIGLRVDANGALWTHDDALDAALAGSELQVDVVSGSVTANAGTNLNTSLLALESGGNLATIAGDTTSIQTAVELIDDTVTTLGTDTYTEATSKGLTLGAVRRDADTTLVGTTNEFSPLQVDANGRLKVEAFSGETLPVSLTSTTVTGTVATTNAIVDGWDNTASDGASVSGDVAHDTANAGEPLQMGGHAVSGSASPTSVAAADRTRWIFNQHGIPYTMAGHPNLITREFDFGTTAQTDFDMGSAVVAADERVYITRFEAMCDNANSVAVSVRAGFGATTVPTASATGVNGMIASHPGIAAGSGIVCGNGSGIIAVGAAGLEPRLTTTAATSGNLHVIISYYVIDETP